MKLVREALSSLDRHNADDKTYRPMRGRLALFYIQNATQRELEGMEALLTLAGHKNDSCPNYTDLISCGFWVDIEDIPEFKDAYREAKGALAAYLEQQQIEAERADEPRRRQAEFFGMPDHKQHFAIQSAHAAALAINATYHLAPASAELVDALNASPVCGAVYLHRNSAISERFVVTRLAVYVIYDELNKRCKRLAEVNPEQIIDNGLCFQMEAAAGTYTPLAGVVENSDNPLDCDYLDSLLGNMFVIPTDDQLRQEEEAGMVALWGRMESLHGQYILPDLAVDELGVIGTWHENGEIVTQRLYSGPNIQKAYDYAYAANESEERYQRQQQANEQAAEAACTRFYEEGHGETAYQLEDEERWSGR